MFAKNRTFLRLLLAIIAKGALLFQDEVTTAPAVAAEADGEPDAKKSKTEETVTKTVKKAMTFVSLVEALKVRCCLLFA